MNRRGFLGALLGAATFDPETLLWVPGQKVISIPSGKSLERKLAEGVLNFEFRSLWKQDIELQIASLPDLISSAIRYNGQSYIGNATAIRFPVDPVWLQR
jgi:hypothetical protein